MRKTSMKKLTAMLLTLCFAMMLVGCGEEGKGGGAKKPEGTKPATDTKAK